MYQHKLIIKEVIFRFFKRIFPSLPDAFVHLLPLECVKYTQICVRYIQRPMLMLNWRVHCLKIHNSNRRMRMAKIPIGRNPFAGFPNGRKPFAQMPISRGVVCPNASWPNMPSDRMPIGRIFFLARFLMAEIHLCEVPNGLMSKWPKTSWPDSKQPKPVWGMPNSRKPFDKWPNSRKPYSQMLKNCKSYAQ